MLEKKPDWIRVKTRHSEDLVKTKQILDKHLLETVCEQASCPNLCECFSRKTATFMILGSICTRSCSFCDVKKGVPLLPDDGEAMRICTAVYELGLEHVVITSVTRDDLVDGGAGHFAKVISLMHERNMAVTIEALIPDFSGDKTALAKVIESGPDIINHNIETVPVLYPAVRPMAVYERSLDILRGIKDVSTNILTKSGIMLGLGEKLDEVRMVFKDLKNAGCDMLTIGQYLQPSKEHHRVVEYIHPDVFEELKLEALNLGFKHVASSPFVRSSYMAERVFK